MSIAEQKVFVSGCFDMLHSGHVAFLEEAASYGQLYVGIGSDKNVYHLKGRYPINSELERKYMVEALECVHRCYVNQGMGMLDFRQELNEIAPDIFVVNEDGDTPQKSDLVHGLGMKYEVLKRVPHEDLTPRSTTALRNVVTMPYRIDLAGGWLDQPFVSKHFPGPVLTVSIEPTVEFNLRSGMATSTRLKALELWQTDIPLADHEHLSKILFRYDNPPGTKVISGSQDALGIVMPGLNKHWYEGGYWPSQIKSVHEEGVLQFIENHLYLISLGPREFDYDVLANTSINAKKAHALSAAAEACWEAILQQDIQAFGKGFRASFEAQVAMFPNMIDPAITRIIDQYKDQALGWKLSGAGGGGYLICVSPNKIEGAIQVKIRRLNGRM